MTVPRPAHEYTPARSPRMVLVVLSVSEVLNAMKTAGSQATPGAIKRECARHALREVGDQKVSYAALLGTTFGGHLPRPRHRMTAMRIIDRLLEPSLDEQFRVRDSIVVTDSDEGETYQATLPGGRTVVLAEIPETTVEQALQAAQQLSQSAAYCQLRAALDSLSAAIVSIDGKPITASLLRGRSWDQHFSVRETLLLQVVLNEMLSGSLEDALVPLESTSVGSGT